MKILNFILVGTLAKFENVGNFPSPRFNQNCESIQNAEMCETACGNALVECTYPCQRRRFLYDGPTNLGIWYFLVKQTYINFAAQLSLPENSVVFLIFSPKKVEIEIKVRQSTID